MFFLWHIISLLGPEVTTQYIMLCSESLRLISNRPTRGPGARNTAPRHAVLIQAQQMRSYRQVPQGQHKPDVEARAGTLNALQLAAPGFGCGADRPPPLEARYPVPRSLSFWSHSYGDRFKIGWNLTAATLHRIQKSASLPKNVIHTIVGPRCLCKWQ